MLGHLIMGSRAEVHKSKSEYVMALDIRMQLLHQVPIEHDPYAHAFALISIAEIEVSIGTSQQDVLKNIDIARSIFNKVGALRAVTCCDATLGDLELREGNMLTAKSLFEECLKLSWGNNVAIVTYCLERLADLKCWGTTKWVSTWTMMFLGHALKSKQKLEIYKGFQFLGNVFLTQGDHVTAVSLLSLALEGLTQMDVHRSRAECML
ncbi:hypothetical protein C8R44DRAFT_794662 [Mycena epipterygia]|nr:hypothetical protein C8R44DRAFT_794662 [Mycena epipterygia]